MATAANGILTEMLGDLEHETLALVLGLERVQNCRQRAVELHVDDGAHDLANATYVVCHLFRPRRCACLERFRARDDFDELFGDLRLALAVILDRQLVDHVARVARRAVHRGHPRALL